MIVGAPMTAIRANALTRQLASRRAKKSTDEKKASPQARFFIDDGSAD
jgi:hypothetical protein